MRIRKMGQEPTEYEFTNQIITAIQLNGFSHFSKGTPFNTEHLFRNPDMKVSEYSNATRIIDALPTNHAKSFGKIQTFIHPDILSDEIFTTKLLEKGPGYLEYATDNQKNDPELVATLMKKNPFVITSASEQLRDDKEFILGMLNEKLRIPKIQCLSGRLKDDIEIVKKAIEFESSNYEYASPRLKENLDIFFMAIKANDQNCSYAPESITKNDEIMRQAITLNGGCLLEASDTLKNDRELAFIALKSNNLSFEFMPPKFQADRDIIIQACKGEKGQLNHQYIAPEIKQKIGNADPVKFLESEMLAERLEQKLHKKAPEQQRGRKI